MTPQIDLAALRRNLDILREGRSMTMIMGIDHAEALLRVVEAGVAVHEARRDGLSTATLHERMKAHDAALAPFLPGKESDRALALEGGSDA